MNHFIKNLRKILTILPITVLAALGLISASAAAQVDTIKQLEPGVAIMFAAARVEDSQIHLTPYQSENIKKVIRNLQLGKNEAALKRWEGFVANLVFDGHSPNDIDVNALILWVMRQSYIENSADLSLLADSVQYYNSQKKAMRIVVRKARAYRRILEKLNQPTVAIDFEIDSLRAVAANLNEDDQLAKVDLKNMLQKQNQTLQMISQISKQLNDTAMAVIRKIG